MALASADNPLTNKETCKWIFDTFRYYKEVAFTALWDSPNHGRYMRPPAAPSHPRDARDFRIVIEKTFASFDVPLTVIDGDDWTRYSVREAAANAVLDCVLSLGKVFDGIYRFFDLPTELRTAVYEMVFRYPSSGLRYQSEDRRFRVLTRSLVDLSNSTDCCESVDDWSLLSDTPPLELHTHPVGQVIAPLTTSRQIYVEALPVFYQIDHLHFWDCQHLGRCLLGRAGSRKKYIRHIFANFEGDEKSIISALKCLTELEDLRHLNLLFDEEARLSQSKGGQIKEYDSILKLPGLSHLRGIRGLVQVILRGCPTLEAQVKAAMLLPKLAMPSILLKTGKRKAQQDSSIAASKGGKAKKAKGS